MMASELTCVAANQWLHAFRPTMTPLCSLPSDVADSGSSLKSSQKAHAWRTHRPHEGEEGGEEYQIEEEARQVSRASRYWRASMKKSRIRFVMAVARALGVPVDVTLLSLGQGRRRSAPPDVSPARSKKLTCRWRQTRQRYRPWRSVPYRL